MLNENYISVVQLDKEKLEDKMENQMKNIKELNDIPNKWKIFARQRRISTVSLQRATSSSRWVNRSKQIEKQCDLELYTERKDWQFEREHRNEEGVVQWFRIQTWHHARKEYRGCKTRKWNEGRELAQDGGHRDANGGQVKRLLGCADANQTPRERGEREKMSEKYLEPFKRRRRIWFLLWLKLEATKVRKNHHSS